MSCLEQLTLYIHVKGRNRVLDGTYVQRDILDYMPQLHSFTFYIGTYVDTIGLSYKLSNENIRRTLTNIGQQHATSIVNYVSTDKAACSIFSLPFAFDYLEHLGNAFPNIVFTYVTYLLVEDDDPFKHEFFIRIARSFPLLKYLRIFNIESPVLCDLMTSESGNNKLYKRDHDCSQIEENNNKKKKHNMCSKCQDREDMKTLLTIATSGTHFTFNNQYYKQHNGVAMGSPLAPIIADIFMINLENNIMKKLRNSGVLWDIARKNGYPYNFVECQIRHTLNRYLRKQKMNETENKKDCQDNNIKEIKDKNKNDNIIVDVPYVGKSTSKFIKDIKQLAKRIKPETSILAIQRPSPKVGQFFKNKDKTLKNSQSGVVYQIKCNSCSSSYIGQTNRQLTRRLKEHGEIQINPTKQQQQKQKSLQHQQQLHQLRRSDRIASKNLPIISYYESDTSSDTISDNGMFLINNQNESKNNSAVYRHMTETNHQMDWQNVKLLYKDKHPYKLLVKESLAILEHVPTLNLTTQSTPLIPFSLFSCTHKLSDTSINVTIPFCEPQATRRP
ncbi:unnamed protein product [Rotaria sordida]|nr:unnamed protein product [Rotaria sordida]